MINHFTTINPIAKEKKNIISEQKKIFKNHRVKVNNLPDGTSEVILENIDNVIKRKPYSLIVHAGPMI